MDNSPPAAQQSRNRLLAQLPSNEFRELQAYLEPLKLELRQVVYRARSNLDYVYFPASGIVSAMAVMADGNAIEVAAIGNEGLVGLTAFKGGDTSPDEVIVQAAGEGWRISAREFTRQAEADGPLRQILIRYDMAFSVQLSYSIACNGLHKLEQRCCRWLLMSQDRIGSSTLPLTHEFLSIMLGVRRASVSDVLKPLQQGGLIYNGRSRIEIRDRAGLEARSCECYRAVTDEYNRLLG